VKKNKSHSMVIRDVKAALNKTGFFIVVAKESDDEYRFEGEGTINQHLKLNIDIDFTHKIIRIRATIFDAKIPSDPVAIKLVTNALNHDFASFYSLYVSDDGYLSFGSGLDFVGVGSNYPQLSKYIKIIMNDSAVRFLDVCAGVDDVVNCKMDGMPIIN
jgi:hypothetical protein